MREGVVRALHDTERFPSITNWEKWDAMRCPPLAALPMALIVMQQPCQFPVTLRQKIFDALIKNYEDLLRRPVKSFRL